ncbi:hypothetical protein DRN44_04125 [Thermococci archaeon]|nr:MAG: hypothetical protein DRN44_04125 [Thermococci archaeon]
MFYNSTGGFCISRGTILQEESEESYSIKCILKDILENMDILEVEEKPINSYGSFFKCRIRDVDAFFQVAELFFMLYLLEKFYHRKFPLTNTNTGKSGTESPHHMQSRYPRTQQARIINFDEKVLVLTYFPSHEIYLIPPGKFIVPDLYEYLRRNARKFVKKSRNLPLPDFCPMLISFKYHIAISWNLHESAYKTFIKYLDEISSYKCNDDCRCVSKIIELARDNPDLLMVLGGKWNLFDKLDFEKISELFNEEDLDSKSPYEIIMNFITGCYLSHTHSVYFNSNLRMPIANQQLQFDILLSRFNEDGNLDKIVIIETTREHEIYNPKKINKKLLEPFKHVILISGHLLNISYEDIPKRMMYVLISFSKSLTDDGIHNKILKSGQKAFNMTTIELKNEDLYKYIGDPKYFQKDKLKEILSEFRNQLDALDI